jgi:hypothetical protein
MTAIKKYKTRRVVGKGGLVKFVSTPIEEDPVPPKKEIVTEDWKDVEITKLMATIVRLSKELQDIKSKKDYIISDQPFRKSEPESSDVMAIAPVSTYDCYK